MTINCRGEGVISRTTVSDYSERYSRRASVSIGDHTNSMSVYILCVYTYVCAGVSVCVCLRVQCALYINSLALSTRTRTLQPTL